MVFATKVKYSGVFQIFKILVPATTANMGSGFDCIGMAFQLYNELTVETLTEASDLQIIAGDGIPANKDNLIYKTIAEFYKNIDKPVPPIKLTQRDAIPIAKGLGSSAACIVAGLFAANELSGSEMTRDELAQLACRIEGHPDNVTPAIYGGIVVGAMTRDGTQIIKITPPPELAYVALIPQYTLFTEHSRSILPENYTRAEAVFNASRTALLIAAISTGSWESLAVATDDRLHQPYRKSLVPGMDELFEQSMQSGAKGVFLSGAGPIIIALVMKRDLKPFLDCMSGYAANLGNGWRVTELLPDNGGARIIR